MVTSSRSKSVLTKRSDSRIVTLNDLRLFFNILSEARVIYAERDFEEKAGKEAGREHRRIQRAPLIREKAFHLGSDKSA